MATSEREVSSHSGPAAGPEAPRIEDDASTAFALRKEDLAEQVGGVANALRSTVDQLKAQDQAAFAQVADSLASGLERLSITLRDEDVNGIIDRTQQFARRQPGIFVGSAVAAGFLLSRLLDSSRPLAENKPSRAADPSADAGKKQQSAAAKRVSEDHADMPGAHPVAAASSPGETDPALDGPLR